MPTPSHTPDLRVGVSSTRPRPQEPHRAVAAFCRTQAIYISWVAINRRDVPSSVARISKHALSSVSCSRSAQIEYWQPGMASIFRQLQCRSSLLFSCHLLSLLLSLFLLSLFSVPNRAHVGPCLWKLTLVSFTCTSALLHRSTLTEASH